MDKISKYIAEEETGIIEELFKRQFNFQRRSDIFNSLNNINDINVINSGLKHLKKEIKEMSEEKINTEKPDKIVKIVREILKFKKQNQDGKGIKILTLIQMLSRLPISLAQLKAVNNSEKLKNEIRQLLYFLYRSKI